jgi:hypothetical protein
MEQKIIVNTGLGDRAEEFARMVFPNGKKAGNAWVVGSLAGEIGKSLSVALNGPKAGCWIDRASGESGDALALWMHWRGQDFLTALRSAGEWLGIAMDRREKRHQSNPQPISPPVKPPLTLPADSTSGTEADWAELASLRQVSEYAVWSAANHGALFFGTCCGQRSWILTDRRRLIAEARRMDGKLFAAGGGLAERKSHTIKGSTKSWPIGLDLNGLAFEDFKKILVVEGGPDYLAALHFVLEGKGDCLPIAMMGGSASMHPKAVEILKGKRIRFYPHQDENGAGMDAVERWIDQIDPERTKCDWWEFEGKKADGALIKDLNDCTSIAAEDAGKLEGLLP